MRDAGCSTEVGQRMVGGLTKLTVPAVHQKALRCPHTGRDLSLPSEHSRLAGHTSPKWWARDGQGLGSGGRKRGLFRDSGRPPMGGTGRPGPQASQRGIRGAGLALDTGSLGVWLEHGEGWREGLETWGGADPAGHPDLVCPRGPAPGSPKEAGPWDTVEPRYGAGIRPE